MTIGQVASLAAVGVDTIRYYERLGLVAAAGRGASGYRIFDATTVERIGLVKEMQELGLTLAEIVEMLAAAERGSMCTTEMMRLESVLRRTDEKIAALTAAREKLETALAKCSQRQCDMLERARGSGKRGVR